MKFELLIASRLKLKKDGEKSDSPSLNIAILGIVLAVIVMVFALTIVFGFKDGISTKIYELEPHIKITNATLGLDDNMSKVNFDEVLDYLKQDTAILSQSKNICLMADIPVMLKSETEFKGLVFRGVDDNYDWSIIENSLVEGQIPKITSKKQEIILSQKLANELRLKLNDEILSYFFINGNIKARKVKVVGIINSNFDVFDTSIIIGNISLLQDVNKWRKNEGNYIAVNLYDVGRISKESYHILTTLDQGFYQSHQATTLYNVSHTLRYNRSYFAWLNLLDMNVIIVITLMAVVSSFTLISALLMIILERIRLIGLLKTLGATNKSIRIIFIHLTQKLIYKSILIGNVIAIILSVIQDKFHIVHLDPESYYLSYVPISINWCAIILLNLIIIMLSYATLVIPSLVISKIKPSTTLRFE